MVVVECPCRATFMSSKMNQPLVSIVIPTYNREGIASRAIDSALAQSYPMTEVIVVDDGSTDDTIRMLGKYDGRISVIRQENSGPSAARNTGAREAKGELIAFLDSDDVWLPEKISRQVSCNAWLIDGQPGKPAGRTSFGLSGLNVRLAEGFMMNPAPILATRFVLFNQVALIRRAAFESVGGFKPELRLLEDYDIAFRLSLIGPWAFIAEPLVEKHDDTVGIGVAAMRDPLAHSLAWSKVLEGMLEQRTSGGDQKVWKLLDRALDEAKSEIDIMRRISTAGRSGRMLANLQWFVLRKRQGLRRNAPGWPRVQAVPA
jgi:glycosyltransferase involved in cell wall biosynthesis